MATYLCVSTSVYALDPSALPQNGQAVAGDTILDYQNGNTLNINQSSNNTIIEWQSFDIGEGATVNFLQPDQNALAVNRVLGSNANPSVILGRLNANGRVMILDRNGVIFGKNSTIDVGGIIVSTGDVSNVDILDGDGVFMFNNITNAPIELNGNVSIKDAGLAALVSKNVINNGFINARLGTVALAGGEQVTLDFYGDGLVEIASEGLGSAFNIENTGHIFSEGGYITMTAPEAKNALDSVINVSGVLSASSAAYDGGKIVLSGGHNINVSGEVSASGVSGGEILIGGDYLGLGDTTHSQRTIIQKTAKISANSVHAGDGGRVIVWSDKQTSVAGAIEAKAGDASGNGGFIETSSKEKLNVQGAASINTSSKNGKAGEWLLDPHSMTIRDAAGTDASGGGTIDAAINSEVVDVNTIETALNNGMSVTITTGSTGVQDGVIVLEDGINKSSGADASFTLQAAENIHIANYDSDGDIPNITSTSGALNITLNSDRDANGSGFIYVNAATLNSNGGNIILGGGVDPLLTSAKGNALRDEGVTIAAGSILNAGSGDISIRGQALNNAAASNLNGILSTAGSEIITTTGNIYLKGQAGNGVDNNRGVYLSNTNVRSIDGDLTIIGNGGSIGAADSDNNYGVLVEGTSAVQTTNNGNIIVTGAGGSGEDANMGVYFIGSNTSLQTVNGDIIVTGQGGSNGNATSGFSHGVLVNSAAQIRSIGTGENAGTISLTGTGASGEDSNDGIVFTGGGGLTSIDGNVTLHATGGGTGIADSNSNYGILINTGSEVSSTGTGEHAANITINGTGGSGEDSNIGIYVLGVGANINTVDGDITLVGQGGSIGNSGSNGAFGVLMNGGGAIQSTGTGAGAGNINIQVSGGNGEDNNHGIYVLGATTKITSVDGDIGITAQGGSNGTASSANNYGVFLNASEISSTGSGQHAANITLKGTAGAGDDSNSGIAIATGARVNSIDGDISLTGQGASWGQANSNFNHGVLIASTSIVETTGVGDGAGHITINGSGGVGHTGGRGVYITDANTRLITADGNISVTGNAYYNNALSNANDNEGIYFTSGAEIQSINGDVSLSGYGRGNGLLNNGIRMYSSGADTAIKVTGNGGISLYGEGGDGTISSGIRLLQPNSFLSAHNGGVSLIGRATLGDNVGVYITNGSDVLSTGTGNVSIDAIGSGSSVDLNVSGSDETTFGGAGASGFISIKANMMTIEGDNIIQTTNNVKFATQNNSNNIGVGAASGNLVLDNTVFSTLDIGGKLIIGDGNQDIYLDSVNLDSENYSLEVKGRNITLGNFVDVGKSLVMNAVNLMTLNGRASSNDSGDSLVLVAKRFLNNFGKSALDSGNGRSLIYASSLENVNAGGIEGDFYFARRYEGYPPSTIPGERTAFVFEAPASTYFGGNVDNRLSAAQSPSQYRENDKDIDRLQNEKSGNNSISMGSSECLVSEESSLYCTISK